MSTEVDRSMQKLKTQPAPPYFLSYEIVDTHSYSVIRAFGQLTATNEGRNRQLGIDLRVGDHSMDNTREIRGGLRIDPAGNFSFASIPIDDDPDAIRAVLWNRTDERYKRAVEQLTTVETNVQVEVAAEDKSDDFAVVARDGKSFVRFWALKCRLWNSRILIKFRIHMYSRSGNVIRAICYKHFSLSPLNHPGYRDFLQCQSPA
jgi:hypothetical protein